MVIRPGDSFLICVLAHGSQSGSALLGRYFSTKLELYNALRSLRAGAKVSIRTTACYGGEWEGLAK
jgi:hypothetical protein